MYLRAVLCHHMVWFAVSGTYVSISTRFSRSSMSLTHPLLKIRRCAFIVTVLVSFRYSRGASVCKFRVNYTMRPSWPLTGLVLRSFEGFPRRRDRHHDPLIHHISRIFQKGAENVPGGMDVTDAARVFNVAFDFDTERASETATCDLELKYRPGSQDPYSTMGKYNGVRLYKTNTIAKLKQAGEYILVVRGCSDPPSLPAPTQLAFTVTARKRRSAADPLLIGSFQFSADKETAAEGIQSTLIVFLVLLLSILFVFCIGQGASWARNRNRRLSRPPIREREPPVENVITEVLGLEKLPENDGEWRELFNSICEGSPDEAATSDEPSTSPSPSPMGWLNDYWHCSENKESFSLAGKKLSPTGGDDSGEEEDFFEESTSKKTQ